MPASRRPAKTSWSLSVRANDTRWRAALVASSPRRHRQQHQWRHRQQTTWRHRQQHGVITNTTALQHTGRTLKATSPGTRAALSKPCACKNTGGTYLPSSSPPCLGQNTLPPSPDFDCAPPPGSSSCDPHRGSTSGAPQEDGTPEEDAVDSLQRHRAVVRNGELAHGAVP